MVTSQSRQNHYLVHRPRLRPNPLTTPCLCWCCRSASTCPGRSNLWYQVLIDQKPRPRKNTFSSSSLGWPPSPTPLYNGISRSLQGECGMGGFAEHSWTWTFSFWNWQNLREGGVCIGLVVVKKGLMSSATPIDVFIRGLFPPTWAQRSPGWFVSVCLVENHRVWFSFAAGNLTAGQHDITRYLPKRRPE